MKDKLAKLIKEAEKAFPNNKPVLDIEEFVADYLLENGVIVLPCKVGLKIYRLDRHVWHNECCHCEHYRIGGFGDPSECGATRDGLKHPMCTEIIEEVATQHDILYNLTYGNFGKTVFLTREEAEQVLDNWEK